MACRPIEFYLCVEIALRLAEVSTTGDGHLAIDQSRILPYPSIFCDDIICENGYCRELVLREEREVYRK